MLINPATFDILANVALPTVFGHLIGMIVAVWPVIALEAFFIRQV